MKINRRKRQKIAKKVLKVLKKLTITGVLHETENNTKYQNVRPH